jgi:hypothetical protein
MTLKEIVSQIHVFLGNALKLIKDITYFFESLSV